MRAGPNIAVSCVLAIALVTIGVSARATAQDAPEASTTDEARQLFEAGTEALRSERYDDAIALLSRSHALLPNVANAFNLAVALLRGGRVRDSLALLAEVQRETFGALSTEQRAAVEQRVADGRRALASLRISASPEAEISIDDVVLGTVASEPLVHEIDPGEHRIAARAPGFVSEARTIEARAGSETRIELALRADVARSPAPGTAPPDVSSEANGANGGDDAWVWVLGTIGVLAVAGGIVLAVVLSSREADPIVDPVTGIGETLVGPLSIHW